jgi:ABC-type maltose transport system permease subunit
MNDFVIIDYLDRIQKEFIDVIKMEIEDAADLDYLNRLDAIVETLQYDLLDLKFDLRQIK